MDEQTSLVDRIEAKRSQDSQGCLSVHSWVSFAHRYLYVAVGKNACTRIKSTLVLLDGEAVPEHLGQVHNMGQRLSSLSTKQIAMILSSPDWFRFCFVRNPYYRLFSAYKSKILNYLDPQYQWVRDKIRSSCGYPLRDGRPAGMVTFRDYVDFVEARLDSVPDAHWARQTDILAIDLVPYDFVGRFERFQQDFEHVLRRLRAPDNVLATRTEVMNPTTPMYHAAAYDHELADHVYRMYEADFTTFGYERDSWLFDHEWASELALKNESRRYV